MAGKIKFGIPARVVRYGFEDRAAGEYSAPGSSRPCVAQAQLAVFRRAGIVPPDTRISGADCDEALNFSLIYGTGLPAEPDRAEPGKKSGPPSVIGRRPGPAPALF